jgi:phospholipase C
MSNQLMKIEHIIVLMLENRSFDHMLGYLSLEGRRKDVDGLIGNEANNYKGKFYKPQRMNSPISEVDPCHDWDCVQEQLKGSNGGFIKNYANYVIDHPEIVMNY